MVKVKCPSCGKKHEINIGSLAASARWESVDKEERSRLMSELAKRPRKKKK